MKTEPSLNVKGASKSLTSERLYSSAGLKNKRVITITPKSADHKKRSRSLSKL